MTRSELIEQIAELQPQLSVKDIELAVKAIIDRMSLSLASGERVKSWFWQFFSSLSSFPVRA